MKPKGEKSMKKTVYTGITFMVVAVISITSSIALAGGNTEPPSFCGDNELECGLKVPSAINLNNLSI